MPNPRRSPEVGTRFGDISRKNSAPAELTEYIPNAGNLSELQTPAGLPDPEEKTEPPRSRSHRKVNGPGTSTSLFLIECYLPYIGCSRIPHTPSLATLPDQPRE